MTLTLQAFESDQQCDGGNVSFSFETQKNLHGDDDDDDHQGTHFHHYDTPFLIKFCSKKTIKKNEKNK